MTLHSNDWGVIGKLVYRYFVRGFLLRAARSTKTTFDDKAIKALDTML